MSDTLTWYDPDFTGDRSKAMVEAATEIANSPESKMRLDESLRIAQMYTQKPLVSLYQLAGTSYGGLDAASELTDWNVLRAASSHATAMVARQDIRPRFQTTNASSLQRRKAEQLQAFADGLMSDGKVHKLARTAMRDCTVLPTGVLQVFIDRDRVRLQRVFDFEIFTEPSPHGNEETRVFYRKRPVPRAKLRRDFGDDGEKTAAINRADTVDLGLGRKTDDVLVWESWVIPTDKESKDGWHLIAMEDGTALLEPEEWKFPWVPLVFLAWEDPLIGSGGDSLCSLIEPIQRRINTLLQRIEKGQRYMCIPRLWWKKGDKPNAVSAAVGSYVESANEPKPLVWPALGPETYNSLNENYAKAWELAGLSRTSAQGMTEEGVNAAVAIRESLKVGDVRLSQQQKMYEGAIVEVMTKMVAFARVIYEKNASYRVSAPMTALLRKIDWKDIDLEEDEMVIDIRPASPLPLEASGRVQKVQELVQAGVFTQEMATQAIADVDPDATMSTIRAPEKLIEKQIDLMVGGKPQHVDEYTNLDYAIKLGTYAINDAEEQEIKDEYIDLIRRYVDEAAFLKARAAAQAAPPAAPPAGAPAAPPVAQAA